MRPFSRSIGHPGRGFSPGPALRSGLRRERDGSRVDTTEALSLYPLHRYLGRVGPAVPVLNISALHRRESPPGPYAASHRRVHACFHGRFGSQDYGPTDDLAPERKGGLPLANGRGLSPRPRLACLPPACPGAKVAALARPGMSTLAPPGRRGLWSPNPRADALGTTTGAGSVHPAPEANALVRPFSCVGRTVDVSRAGGLGYRQPRLVG
jgi:hypothetical protein